MNYKLFTAAIVVLFSQSMWAQSFSSVDVTFNKVSDDDIFIAVPSIKLDVKNHNWSFGPTILFSYGDQIEERESVKLTGVYLGYENFPHGKTSKWNMFHSVDLITQRVRDKQKSQYFDIPNAQFVPNEITQTEISFLLSCNAGVLWNINEKLATISMIGIGFNANLRNTKSSLEEFDDSFFKQIWMLKVGIRYSLNLRK